MSFKNFVPEFWAEKIEHELERKCVFAEDCNREYEGEIKDAGDTVNILGVGSPTVKELSRKEANGIIDEAEEVEDTNVKLVVDQVRYYNYLVGDIDKAQAQGNILAALNKETSEKLANSIDKYIGGFAVDTAVKQMFETPEIVTVNNALDIIDRTAEKLYENDVSDSTEIVLTIDPKFFTLFKQAYLKLDTNNHELMKNGKVAQYGNITVKRSNNIYRAGGASYLPMRTKRAIAFAQAITKNEAYRPERRFADAIKGLAVFGAKIVRPKEIFTLNVKYN